MEYRHYDRDRDAARLWALKRAFELELGAGGGDEKAAAYEDKLTDRYRERYLSWVDRCVAEEPGCLTVADCGEPLAGYAFVLPGDLSMIWDAAVLNELYVREANRGGDVADRLMEGAVRRAREQDPPLDRIVLDVAPENERARAFYRRHGFEPWGEMVAREL